MPIYTKTGDAGKTSLVGGVRISKTDHHIAAYGDLDELTSYLGMIAVKLEAAEDADRVQKIQHDLYRIMSTLAGAEQELSGSKSDHIPLNERTGALEQLIDEIDMKLPKLVRFILPGGTKLSSWFHIARACCRRAERAIVAIPTDTHVASGDIRLIMQYVNRLSDLLFVWARWYNNSQEVVT